MAVKVVAAGIVVVAVDTLVVVEGDTVAASLVVDDVADDVADVVV